MLEEQKQLSPSAADKVDQANGGNRVRVQARIVTRPRIDIHEADDAFVLLADMPGADESTTEVLVEKNILTLKGETDLFAPEGFVPVHRESGQRYYERLIRLPEEVDAAKLEATVKNGVLKVILPKNSRARTLRIQVNPG